MKRTIIWTLFLICIATAALWFIFSAGKRLHDYYRLSSKSAVQVSKWEQKELNNNQFAVIAHYQFEFKDKKYNHFSTIGGNYPNPWSAENAIKYFKNKQY